MFYSVSPKCKKINICSFACWYYSVRTAVVPFFKCFFWKTKNNEDCLLFSMRQVGGQWKSDLDLDFNS